MTDYRKATAMEQRDFGRLIVFYEVTCTEAFFRWKAYAEGAAWINNWLNERNIAPKSGPIFTDIDMKFAALNIRKFNTFHRLLLGVYAGQYAMRIRAGDIDILADKSMQKILWENDVWPGTIIPEEGEIAGFGALPLIIYAVAIGVVLIGGAYAALEAMKHDEEIAKARYKAQIQKVDAEMMKSPDPQIRDGWRALRNDVRKAQKEGAEKTGVFVDIFGEEMGGKLGGALGIGLLAIAGAYILPVVFKKQRRR